MKTTALALAALLCGAAPAATAHAAAQAKASEVSMPAPSAAKLTKIRKLLKLTKADQIGTSMLEGMKAQLPPAQYEKVAAVIKPTEIVDLVVGVYAKHFTDKDVDGLLAFYATPLGKRLIEEGPQIAKESMQLGQQYAIQKLSSLRAPPPQGSDAPAK